MGTLQYPHWMGLGGPGPVPIASTGSQLLGTDLFSFQGKAVANLRKRSGCWLPESSWDRAPQGGHVPGVQGQRTTETIRGIGRA